MTSPDTSLRLRPLVSLVVFLSSYAPLLVILVVKDLEATPGGLVPGSPLRSALLLAIAVFSSAIVLLAASSIKSGLPVKVTKATNKSGDMFGYTVPYVISFMKVDSNDWQTLICLGIFLTMMFVLAYRTQTVFVNPVLALRGYMLIDCTFTHQTTEIQAVVLTREPIKVGAEYIFERLSHYLYAATDTISQVPIKDT